MRASPPTRKRGPRRRTSKPALKPAVAPAAPERARLSEVLAALSLALDLAECQPMGHALRTCVIAMEVARRLGLSLQDRRDLYYASLVKDIGGSWTSARV